MHNRVKGKLICLHFGKLSRRVEQLVHNRVKVKLICLHVGKFRCKVVEPVHNRVKIKLNCLHAGQLSRRAASTACAVCTHNRVKDSMTF